MQGSTSRQRCKLGSGETLKVRDIRANAMRVETHTCDDLFCSIALGSRRYSGYSDMETNCLVL